MAPYPRIVRVLFLVTRLPYPPRRGDQVRAYHHLRHLARRHEVICCLVGSPPAAVDVAAVAALGVVVEVIPVRRPTAVTRMGSALWDRRPLQALPAASPRARSLVAELAEGVDVVHAQLVRTGPLVEDLERFHRSGVLF